MKTYNPEVATLQAKGSYQGSHFNKKVATIGKVSDSKVLQKNEVWLTAKEGSYFCGINLSAVKKNCKSGKYITKMVTDNGGKQYRILLSSLPETAQAKYWEQYLKTTSPKDLPSKPTKEELKEEKRLDLEYALELRPNMPDWARNFFDQKFMALKVTECLSGKPEIEKALKEWNKKDSAVKVTESSATVYRLRSLVEECGYAVLYPGYGKKAGQTKIHEEWITFYENEYLSQSRPSSRMCWEMTVGYFRSKNPELKAEDFPGPSSFDRLMRKKRDLSPSMIYRGRYGDEKADKKYANFIIRNNKDVLAGECYVADHKRLDQFVSLPNGKICVPWVTAWVDFRTGKWLSWCVAAGDPNSDRIFQTYYYAVSKFGAPECVYIDNGKDFRVHDFSGGRIVRVRVDEGVATTALALMGTHLRLANPYGPQSKSIIERSYGKVKERYSKLFDGYCGGNTEERPEILEKQLKQGKMLTFEECEKLFDNFIINTLNQKKSDGKILKGTCPDELFDKERMSPRIVKPESLVLICMRSSKDRLIAKNGVKDDETGCYYWGEWMAACKGRKVYIRRDVKSYQEAWCFDAENRSEFLGKAEMMPEAPSLAKTEVDRQRLREVTAINKRAKKVEKEYLKNRDKLELSGSEKLSIMETYVRLENEDRGYKPSEETPKSISIITPMDKAVKKAKDEEQKEVVKKNFYVPEPKVEAKVKKFWYEVEDEAAWLKRMSGGGRSRR